MQGKINIKVGCEFSTQVSQSGFTYPKPSVGSGKQKLFLKGDGEQVSETNRADSAQAKPLGGHPGFET